MLYDIPNGKLLVMFAYTLYVFYSGVIRSAKRETVGVAVRMNIQLKYIYFLHIGKSTTTSTRTQGHTYYTCTARRYLKTQTITLAFIRWKEYTISG